MLIVLELGILQLWFGLCMVLLSLDVMMLSVNALDQDWVEQTLIKLKRELKVNQKLKISWNVPEINLHFRLVETKICAIQFWLKRKKERKLVIYLLFYCGFTSFSYHGLRLIRTLHSPTNKQSLSICAWLHVFNIPQRMNGTGCMAIIITVHIDVVIITRS